MSLILAVGLQAQSVTPFKKGDRVAFVGNSITDGGHYHSYIWLYYMTRFPDQRMKMFNCGIGGDTGQHILNRLDGDVFSKNPNIITLSFGMNDSGYFEYNGDNPEEFGRRQVDRSRESFLGIEKKLKEHPEIRKVMIGTSPYDQTSTFNNEVFRNKNDYMVKIVAFQDSAARANGWEMVDFNAPMLAVNAREQSKDPAFTLIGSDRIHPDNDGHMYMAYLFLKAQGLDGRPVARFQVDARSGRTVTERCAIDDFSGNGGTVSFSYLAESLPFPLDTIAHGWNMHRPQADILKFCPEFMEEMNMEEMRVSGLDRAGRYRLLIDDVVVDTFTGDQLSKGVNLAAYRHTPQYEQARKVMSLNEERWEIERRFCDYAWLQYNFFMPRGLLEANDEHAARVFREGAAKDGWVAGKRDLYDRMIHKEVRDAYKAEMELLEDLIYTVNQPRKRTVRLIPVDIQVAEESLVGEGIVRFTPVGFDPEVTPPLILSHEPSAIGKKPSRWTLNPRYESSDSGSIVTLDLPFGTSVYGGGEVTGPLLRNGTTIKLWNTDTGMYLVDNGSRLYQSHPWLLGLRPDGSAFGVLFDTFHRAELSVVDGKEDGKKSESGKIVFSSEGTPCKTYIIDRKSPQEVLKCLGQLTGTIEMPPLWSLGYHQCRFSYVPEAKVRDVADNFRKRHIPCDVIWFDINYMDGFRIFTVSDREFPDPAGMNRYLHDNGFHTVYMIDPGVKVDDDYHVYASGRKADLFVKDADGNEYHGKVWPGDCAFPDFTMPSARRWWGGLYKDFLALGIDGIWNDMNEPSIFEGAGGTMPVDCIHRGGEGLPGGPHSMWHNAYGRLMVEASRDGIMAARPDRRPFVLSRSNLLGGQRYAATWTGDNAASPEHMRLSVPMSLTLGLSGQPFNGPDIGGFAGDADGELFGSWIGFGAFFPFMRGHASCDTNDKEPWAFGPEVEREARMAIERRYRLMPYIYTAFRKAHTDGAPVMAPVFFADPKDPDLLSEEQAFLLGEDLLVVPAFAENPSLPSGIWETVSLVDGDTEGKYQACLKMRGGAIIPTGKVVENLNQNLFDPLTLLVCLDEKDNAEGSLYWDAGEGWDFRQGDYCRLVFKAKKRGDKVTVTVAAREGKMNLPADKLRVEVISGGRVYSSSGSLDAPVTVVI